MLTTIMQLLLTLIPEEASYVSVHVCTKQEVGMGLLMRRSIYPGIGIFAVACIAYNLLK